MPYAPTAVDSDFGYLNELFHPGPFASLRRRSGHALREINLLRSLFPITPILHYSIPPHFPASNSLSAWRAKEKSLISSNGRFFSANLSI
jgi:hypothetical protein